MDLGAARALHALYQMGELEACAAAAQRVEGDPVARRLRALCLGEMDDLAALDELAALLREDPEDGELAAALLSHQLRRGLLPEAGPFRPDPPAGAYRGAAAWLRGQQLAVAGRPREGAAEFALAARYFRAGPTGTRSERLAAAYVGLAISHLAAGDAAAAQLAYTRILAGEAPGVGVGELAARTFQTAEALRGLSASELAEVAAPLAEAVGRIRLRVLFHRPGRPAVLLWDAH
jgi:hypothetical protein